MMESLILGIVEGITEFLPISSTGHLILTGKVLGLAQTDFLKSFDIAIQLGAILSVVFLYWRSLIIKHDVLKKVMAAFIPTAFLGLLFYKAIKKTLMQNEAVVLWALFIGGIFLIIFELLYRQKENAVDNISDISYIQCIAIGLFQSVAFIPGVSRAAATIIGGLILGLKRKTIVEFSFLLAVPTMLAATGLDLLKSANCFSTGQFMFILTGLLTSFFVAMISIKFLLYFIKNHNFIPFGIYRIALAVIFFLMFMR